MAEIERAKRRLHFMLGFVAALGLVLFAVPILVLAGPHLEPMVLPVLSDMRAVKQEREYTTIALTVEGTRRRGACQLEQVSALAASPGKPAEFVMSAFPLARVHAPGQLISRPEGYQSFGVWRFWPVAQGDQLSIVLRYSCHALWDTMTTLGPWEVTQ